MTSLNSANEAQRHLDDLPRVHMISREEWAFHQQTINEQTRRNQYPGYVVLESDERGH